MAKILGKDPVTYTKERDGFLRDLQHFHESRGTPFRRAPILSGREIDLYLLYSLVTAQGGWIKVNSKNAWTELFEYFRVPGKCVNGSIALKQIYLRYLDRWEKVHYLGEEADRGSDDDEESRHKRWSARALHSVPLTYNYTQHNIAESTREYNHLSTDLYKCSDYDRLALSLLSPLPNEQDFAINVCTLLSNDGKHTLKIEKHPRLIDYLIAHAGVFNHHSLRNVFIESYSKIRGHPLHTFWKDVVHSEEYLDLTDERKYMPEKDPKLTEKGTKAEEPSQPITSEINTGIINVEVLKESPITKSPEPMIVDSEPVNVDSDSELFASDDVEATTSLNPSYIFKLKPHSSDKDIFCLGRSLGTRDYVGQRVLQVATILRNLTFIEENVPILTKNRTFIRFMLLCVCSRWNQLQNLGMDMLGNVATEFLVKDPQTDKLTFFLIKLVSNGLLSEDRNSCISSLDALNKLSQNEANEDSLSRCLESFVYTRVCSFLTIHDVMLLIYTLECLYSLSSLGERPCNFIVGNHGVVDTLVSLVTVEGKSYGPKACIGMKLVETVPGGNANSSANNSNSSTTTSSTSTTVSSSSTNSTSTTTSTVTTLHSAPKVSTSQSHTPQRVVQVAPQRLIAITPVSSPAATPTPITSTQTPTPSISPQQLVQQQHAHQQAIQENEQFALAWLRATYEPCSTGRVDHQELYKHYINSCAKIGRRGVIAPLHFPRCVRSVFGGTVGPNPVKPVTSNDPQFYDGIKARAQQLVINMQPVTTPVAQATPKTIRRKAQNVTVVPVSTPTTPTLTVVADNTDTPPASPASPILKAQLSAPPKPRESTVVTTISKSDIKSQVMAHPHLSQALLGSAATTAVTQAGTSKDAVAGQSNTSLIKSLLATKVNECMTSVSMRTATDCQIVTTQVAARQQQQRLLAQQTTPMQTPDSKSSTKLFDTTPKSSRINGARQLFSETDTTDSDVSSTTQHNSNKNRREPPQPPPPLAPLSGNLKGKVLRIENEDSDSTGNNSLASSTGLGHVGLGGVSSTEDGDNSLTSFEGLLNGIPSLDNPLNDDSNSKDSLKSSIKKPLMLADLLEKKVEKDPMLLNGVLGKELRLGEKGLDLVENHIEKVLSKENNMNESSIIDATGTNNLDKNNDVNKQTLKRSASEELTEPDAKKIHLSNVNGNADSPAPESVSSSNGDEQPTEKVSTAAAKLFADMAADILEDEDEEELMQEAVGHQQQAPQTVVEDPNVVQIASNTAGVSQMFVDGNQQVLLQPRQIIVSQPQLQTTNQMVIPAGTQLKTQGGQTVIVQNSAQQRTPVVLQQANAGQILLSQGLQSIQGQVQLVASSSQPGQYVIQTGGPQSAYVVAQSQTAMVHGQPQTVLVAQTPQQQGTGTKTIIILQQQPTPSATATHHQKVVVTPQGQQVVVTQVQRPILQTSTVSNNPPPTSTVIKSVGSTTTTQVTPVSTSSNTITVIEKKIEDVKPQPRMKINRDMSTPFVCEWGDCQVDIKFTSANQVYLHVCEEHVPKGSEEIVCQWERCDNMKRKRFSLMTHLNDKHCNTEAMRASLTRRRQMSHAGKVESPVTNTATPHPGYAPDAAFHAIKRHALEFVNPKELQRSSKQGTTVSSTATPPPRPGPPATEQDDNEGPVTKSIRLTASLILRNLVIYSSNCRRYLKHYEPHLANVALSNVESSRTIAQVLYDMNEGASHR